MVCVSSNEASEPSGEGLRITQSGLPLGCVVIQIPVVNHRAIMHWPWGLEEEGCVLLNLSDEL